MASADPDSPALRRVPPRPEAAPPAVRAPRYRPGDVIGGKYRLLGLLGRGGMGDVWLAHNDTLDIDVAVKVIRGAGADPDDARRLLVEARAAARLGHPAIVRILDFGRGDAGEPFIVMERLIGEDLTAAVRRRGRLSPETGVRTLLPIAHALSVAHAKRIVHRDLKPENIFLAQSEGEKLQPTVVDFGIAQVDRGTGHRSTAAGILLGSPAYMSPEQARGDEIDHRSDIWSFCVVLYEVVTGTSPFVEETPGATIVAIMERPPKPMAELGVDDGGLWTIVQQGLQKDPERRFQSMRELGEALAGWLLGRGVKQDITSASLETTWTRRIQGTSLETLNSLPPPGAAPSERTSSGAPGAVAPGAGARAAVAEVVQPAPSRALYWVAAIAGLTGVLGGVAYGSGAFGRTESPGGDTTVLGRALASASAAPPAGPSGEPSARVAGDPVPSAPAPSAPGMGQGPTQGQRAEGTRVASKGSGQAKKASRVAASVEDDAGRAAAPLRPAAVRPRPALKDPFR